MLVPPAVKAAFERIRTVFVQRLFPTRPYTLKAAFIQAGSMLSGSKCIGATTVVDVRMNRGTSLLASEYRGRSDKTDWLWLASVWNWNLLWVTDQSKDRIFGRFVDDGGGEGVWT
jgi:hypothetical protein